MDFEFSGTPLVRANQPKRLSEFGFPAPFDSDLEGALRGRGAFSAFLYLFKNGRYLRLNASTLTPDDPGSEADTASAWGLPPSWTSLDAVVPGRGSKKEFCYFLRGTDYVRFDWAANAASLGYPKSLATEWHMTAPFDANMDGVIAGQGDFGARAFLFRLLPQNVDDFGNLAAGGTGVQTPGFGRFEFDTGLNAGSTVAPVDVLARWPGLLPILDAGPAIDLSLQWCDAGIAALSAPVPSAALGTALAHHFMTAAPTPLQHAQILARLIAIRARLASLPLFFQWTRGLSATAQTLPGVLTELGDGFSRLNGPNGRAAILIHEAVHFTATSVVNIDVPEWSGATINGVTQGVAVADPANPGLLMAIPYSSLTTDQAIENPSSYAAFGQEMFFGVDTRFGAARPHE